jgi:glycosyltransferase 2 family protein
VMLLPQVRRVVRARMMPLLPERIRHTLTQVADASLSYRHEGRALFMTLLVTLAMFVVRIAFAKALALACGLDVPFVELLLIIPILWIIVMLPITIGGIGVQDAGYVVLMSVIGVGPALAFSMSILEHVISRLASLPGALFLGEVEKRSVSPQR